MPELTYGTGLGLGDAIRQRRKTISELSGTPYQTDVLEDWKSGKVISPEEAKQIADTLAYAYKFGKGAIKGTFEGVQAPTIAGVGKYVGGLAKPVLAAGKAANAARQAVKSNTPDELGYKVGKKLNKTAADATKVAQAFYRRAQKTASKYAPVAANIAKNAAIGAVVPAQVEIAGRIAGKLAPVAKKKFGELNRKYATAE